MSVCVLIINKPNDSWQKEKKAKESTKMRMKWKAKFLGFWLLCQINSTFCFGGMAGSGWVGFGLVSTATANATRTLSQIKPSFSSSVRREILAKNHAPKAHTHTHSACNLIRPTHKHFAHAGDKFDGN